MSDDYLWDRSGTPDPEVERLEGLLAGHRHREVDVPRTRRQRPLTRWRIPAAAAALLIGLALFYAFSGKADVADSPTHNSDGWNMRSLAGRDVGTSLIAGHWLETKRGDRVRIEVADIGSVEVLPNSRVRLLETSADEHRLELAEGKIDAVVYAPPRLFFVETPAATAVDLGCSYTLEVDKHGSGILAVTMGHVQLEHDEYESFVPANALCTIKPGRGPGIPYFDNAPDALVDVNPKDPIAVRAAIEASSLAKDTLTLWHLLPRATAELRKPLLDHIASIVQIHGADRAKILALDPETLAATRDTLDLDW